MATTEFSAAAEAFRAGFARLKSETPEPPPGWYPYDSLANVPRIAALMEKAGVERLVEPQGLPLLDLGAADGALSLLFEKRGWQVDAVDHARTNYNNMEGLRRLVFASGSKVRIHDIDVDAGHRLPRANYGLALMLGLLYHLRNPIGVLETLARSSPYLLLSTRLASGNVGPFTKSPVAYLAGASEINNDETNYWLFTRAGYRRLLDRTGWESLADIVDNTGVPRISFGLVRSDHRVFSLARSQFAGTLETIELLDGWYALEQNCWRWTAPSFSIRYRGAAGRALVLECIVPEGLVADGPVTLDAQALGTVEITRAGRQTLRFPPVENAPTELKFRLSRPLLSGADSRRLGLIVSFFQTASGGAAERPPFRPE